jgi:hypothetical protein
MALARSARLTQTLRNQAGGLLSSPRFSILPALAFDFHGDFDVGIDPVDLRQRACQRDPFAHVELGGGRMVRPQGSSRQHG